jgi:DNA-binding IclR family transcriptional regulator
MPTMALSKMVDPDPAPALTRGLRLVAILSSEGACSLDRLAKISGWPKASILRLLRALINAGVAEREVSTKRYRALLRFIPGDSREQCLRQKCRNHVTWLATCAKQPVEVYAYSTIGMTMVDRAAPEHASLPVLARLGHTRPRLELDAVNQIACACTGDKRVPPGNYHAYAEQKKIILTPEAVERIIATVTQRGVASDVGVNRNHVRRFAAPLRNQHGDCIGALAIAHCNDLAPGSGDQRFIQLITSVAKRIGHIVE